MRTAVIAALLCAASLVTPCAHAQQSEADRQALAQLRAQAAKGNAEPNLNWVRHSGWAVLAWRRIMWKQRSGFVKPPSRMTPYLNTIWGFATAMAKA